MIKCIIILNSYQGAILTKDDFNDEWIFKDKISILMINMVRFRDFILLIIKFLLKSLNFLGLLDIYFIGMLLAAGL